MEKNIQHSPRFESLKEKYAKNFVTVETLRGWVELNECRAGKGITAEEFEEITGQAYQVEE